MTVLHRFNCIAIQCQKTIISLFEWCLMHEKPCSIPIFIAGVSTWSLSHNFQSCHDGQVSCHTVPRHVLQRLTLSLLAATFVICWKLYKQFGPTTGPTECQSWSGSKPFDTLIVFLKEFLKKLTFEESQQTTWNTWKIITQNAKTLCLLVSPADNLCKQFGPKSGRTKCQAWSGSELFDNQIVFLKEFLN